MLEETLQVSEEFSLEEFHKKKIDSEEAIKKHYLNKKDVDEEGNLRPWSVGWSGGKDSTAMLGLLINTLKSLDTEQLQRSVYVVMSDTLVENPMLETYMHEQVRLLTEYIKENTLPIHVKLVHPTLEESYFVLTLGRGYFLPLNNGQGRWCTQRLKVKPQQAAMKEINPSLTLVGTRFSESQQREASMHKHSVGEKLGKTSKADTLTFAVIADWTIEDVWHFLSLDQLPWTSSIPVRKLYHEATGECAVANPKGVEKKLLVSKAEACGARFGCWLCPVVRTDRSTEEMTDYHEWLEPLTMYRELQSQVYGSYEPPKVQGMKRKERSEQLRKWEAVNEQVKRITKSGYNRKGTRMKNGHGTFTVEARKFLFAKLMQTQTYVNQLRVVNGLEPMTLISQEQIDFIKWHWENDEKNYPHVITNAENIPIEKLLPLLEGEISKELLEDYKLRWRKKQDARKNK